MDAVTDLVVSDREADLFPRWALSRCRTALVLFAALFYGRQDAYWVNKAGIRATCVDLSGPHLERMAEMYPADWDFVEADVFDYAEFAEQRWDLVTVDCPTNLFDRCAGLLSLWCGLANRVVVLGVSPRTEVEAPAGWVLSERRYRSDFLGGVEWAVLEATG